ncbi:M50 family metallopeptidase [Microlunatus ginsengisoli]|uniref:M50 family metallopeptidase n=1 Tax=Microlunatus ginsengisoli TaxID=363863 RepID=A0ABP7AHP7_9ACTN
MELLGEVWDCATSRQPAPSPATILLCALIALLLVALPTTWRAVRMLVTITHEGAHGVVALLTGRRLHGIRLNADTSGLTVSSGPPRGPGMVATLAAGYLGPAIVGLGATALLLAGYALGVLWALVLLLALLLVQIRNLYGLAVVVGSALVLVGLSWYMPASAQSTLAYVLTWVLLIAAPKPVLELARQRRRGTLRSSDADQLARLTRVPASGWIGLFLVANLAGLVLAAVWLLPGITKAAGSWLGGLVLD